MVSQLMPIRYSPDGEHTSNGSVRFGTDGVDSNSISRHTKQHGTAVTPWLFTHPFQCVITVRSFGTINTIVTTTPSCTSHILHDDGITINGPNHGHESENGSIWSAVVDGSNLAFSNVARDPHTSSQSNSVSHQYIMNKNLMCVHNVIWMKLKFFSKCIFHSCQHCVHFISGDKLET
eukprot:Lithocolla_globosa_v1_NODE_2373_length_2031_cov_70.788462.p2 type:complete len:177 gc:universal NODE_2373_length_2031_cov_70.788462:1304-1834(+)